MSLTVYLILPGVKIDTCELNIPIREDGQTKMISRQEWDNLHPGIEPYHSGAPDQDCVFDYNITHNLNQMADAAGIYKYLWRPDEINISKAGQLIEPLKIGLKELEDNPEKYKALNPANGWGNFEGLVNFVKSYLSACIQYPDADIELSR